MILLASTSHAVATRYVNLITNAATANECERTSTQILSIIGGIVICVPHEFLPGAQEGIGQLK